MTFEAAEVRYAKSGDVHIAYRVFGEGPFDVVRVAGFTSNLDAGFWPAWEAEELEALGRMAQCLIFDKRGTGISDGVPGAPSLEERMDDVRAVMDAAGSRQAVIYGRRDGAAMSVLFAATYPERTLALVLANPEPRFTATTDFPWAPTSEEWDRRTEEEVRSWGRASMRLRSRSVPGSSRTRRPSRRSPAACGWLRAPAPSGPCAR